MNAGGHGSDMAAIAARGSASSTCAAGRMRWCPRPTSTSATAAPRSAPHQVVVRAELRPRPRATGPPPRPRSAEIVRWRREHQPGGANAGSVFTNPPGDSAGRLIDAAGAKGLPDRHAPRCPTKHANFIQADEGGSADDVVALMAEVRAPGGRRTPASTCTPRPACVGFDAAAGAAAGAQLLTGLEGLAGNPRSVVEGRAPTLERPSTAPRSTSTRASPPGADSVESERRRRRRRRLLVARGRRGRRRCGAGSLTRTGVLDVDPIVGRGRGRTSPTTTSLAAAGLARRATSSSTSTRGAAARTVEQLPWVAAATVDTGRRTACVTHRRRRARAGRDGRRPDGRAPCSSTRPGARRSAPAEARHRRARRSLEGVTAGAPGETIAGAPTAPCRPGRRAEPRACASRVDRRGRSSPTARSQLAARARQGVVAAGARRTDLADEGGRRSPRVLGRGRPDATWPASTSACRRPVANPCVPTGSPARCAAIAPVRSIARRCVSTLDLTSTSGGRSRVRQPFDDDHLFDPTATDRPHRRPSQHPRPLRRR